MPSTRRPVRIAALVNGRTAPALVFLLRDVFEVANQLAGETRYGVELVNSAGAGRLAAGDVSIATRRARGQYDYVIAAPLAEAPDEPIPCERELRFVRRQYRGGAVIGSACLGALTLAAAGLLDGREATTHWNWTSFVRSAYPAVKWAPSRVLCDHGDVLTAGGYLAIVDLALRIVERSSSKELSHRVGQQLLANTARQRVSVYAQKFIEARIDHPRLSALADWIERHLDRPLVASELAQRCGMSLRTFYRGFERAFKVTPRKYIQLKRIERAQHLLRTSRKSVEQILTTVGVSDVASFRRVFRRETGYSPAEFRRRLQG